MSMDFENGEVIGDLGSHYVVVPVTKWLDTPMWEEAVQYASLRFEKLGGPWIKIPVGKINPANVLCQEYHKDGLVAFLFEKKFNGKTYYCPAITKIEPEVRAHYTLRGLWPSGIEAMGMN